MARKGNQPKKGVDQTSSNSKKDSEVEVIASDLLGINNGSLPGDGRKKNKKSRNTVSRDEQINGIGNGNRVNDDGLSRDDVEDFSQVDSNMSRVRNLRSKRVNSTFGQRINGLYTANRRGKLEFYRHLAFECLRKYAMPILQMSNEWVEKNRPLFESVANRFHGVSDYVRGKFVQIYPVVLRWLLHAGNILLFLSMVWLDCAFRGMASLLTMGTTSFFSVLWFSVLSVVAMIGMFKFLLVVGVAALIGFFVGFVTSLLIIGVSGAIVLWLYGSFWTTSLVIVLAGISFKSSHERLALLITNVYSVYCVWAYVGWLRFILALNLSFISTDALIYFLKHNMDEERSNEQSSFPGEPHFTHFEFGSGESVDRNPGDASTSGADSEITSEDEIVRLLNCTDHYSALGLSRYQQVDVSVLKREYRKKAMLVHPDKNMGNEKAVEAFKKLQNAYEVLMDTLKRKAYDDELRRDELISYFSRFQSVSQKNGRHGFFPNGFAHSDGDGEDRLGEARRIACKKCGSFHMWFQTKKAKLKARWCQDCKDLHQAKEGDGWIEQSSQPLFFGILQKVDQPVAYVCADSRVYDATEWYICQGMRCPANSHKPSFHVNTNVTKSSHGKGSHRGNMEENMTEEEIYEFFQNIMRSGNFEDFATNESGPKSSGGSGGGSSSSKRKKKGKKPW